VKRRQIGRVREKEEKAVDLAGGWRNISIALVPGIALWGADKRKGMGRKITLEKKKP